MHDIQYKRERIKNMASHFPEEIKQYVVTQYKAGIVAKELCEEFGMTRSTLFKWVKERSVNNNGQIPREQYLLQTELERLRLEVKILTECGCSVNSPMSARLDAVERLYKKYPLRTLCRILDVQRPTVYHRVLRAPEQTQNEKYDEVLKPLIKDIFERSMGRFGVRRIRAKLIEQGHTVSERRISRLMKEMNLFVKKAGPRINSANDRQYQYYPNRLKQNFITEAPNQVWVSDITYARVGYDFLYLCVIVDLYARKVVGYGISEYIDAKLVIDTFQKAYEKRGRPKNLLFHSDQGTQYTCFEFRQMLRGLKVTQSFSAPGNPYDNAVVESFFASIKKEDFRMRFYKTEEEFQLAVDMYIEFYNNYRPHQKLNYMTPDQAESIYFKEKEA